MLLYVTNEVRIQMILATSMSLKSSDLMKKLHSLKLNGTDLVDARKKLLL